MRSASLSLLSAGFAAASFQNTSPFILFSTSEILAAPPQISTAKSITSTLQHELSKCPSDIYIIAHQPNAQAEDYSSDTSALSKYVLGEDRRIRSSFSVAQVVGSVEPATLRETLESKCDAGFMHLEASTGLFDIADEKKPRIINVNFPMLPVGEGRHAAAHVNDLFLENLIDMLPSPNFTVLYITSPMVGQPVKTGDGDSMEQVTYEMDNSQSPLGHMELRRNLGLHSRLDGDGNSTDKLPLFEKYQYFTPGLFMGLFVGVLLLLILYVAISAVAGLQVSYAAFDKEIGPQAQQKKQS